MRGPVKRSRVASLVVCLVCCMGWATPAAASGKFVGVIAVVPKYAGTLKTFNFREVPNRMESALLAFAARRGFARGDIQIVKVDGQAGRPEPTSENILAALQDAALPLTEEDTLVFHFLGHGSTEGEEPVLFTVNAMSPNDKARRVGFRSLEQLLKQSKAALRVAFIDACLIYEGLSAPGAPLAIESDQTLRDLASRNPGLAVFFSTSVGKPAWVENSDKDGQPHSGFFTNQVIEALRNPNAVEGTGKEGSVMVKDLATHLNLEVSKAVRRWNVTLDQQPEVYIGGKTGDIFLFAGPSGRVPRARPVETRSVVTMRVTRQRGAALRQSDLGSGNLAASTAGADAIPTDPQVDLTGGCLTNTVSAGQVLRWSDIGAPGLCDR